MNQLENSHLQPSDLPPGRVVSSVSWSVTNILSVVVLGVSLVWLMWAQIFYSGLDRVAWPEFGLPLVVGRMMELKEALKEVSPWERRLYSSMLIDSPTDLALAITWYEELAAHSADPRISVQLAILQGEAGRIEQVRQRVGQWELQEEPYPQFAHLIIAAYLNPSEPARHFDIQLMRQIGEIWFRERLIARLTGATSDHARGLGSTKLPSLSTRMLRLIRVFAAIGLITTIGGSLALFFILFHSRANPEALSLGTASLPPCWSGTTAIAVLVRSGAIFALLTVGGGILESKTGFSLPILWLCVSVLGILACLALAHRYLFKPFGLEMQQAFGLSFTKATRGRLFLWVASLLGAASLGEWGIMWIAERLSLSAHWTESFDTDFVWGTPPTVGLTGIHAVVFAPIFEELVFRGLLFATLRIKFDFGWAAILSAVMFSLMHGYSITGFLSVAWTGLLWAWSYEKTRSLLPGMIAHAIHNFIWSSALIGFFRG
jgi:uncharacterized protein